MFVRGLTDPDDKMTEVLERLPEVEVVPRCWSILYFYLQT